MMCYQCCMVMSEMWFVWQCTYDVLCDKSSNHLTYEKDCYLDKKAPVYQIDKLHMHNVHVYNE